MKAIECWLCPCTKLVSCNGPIQVRYYCAHSTDEEIALAKVKESAPNQPTPFERQGRFGLPRACHPAATWAHALQGQLAAGTAVQTKPHCHALPGDEFRERSFYEMVIQRCGLDSIL